MNKELDNNSIFIYVLVGSLLFVAFFAFTMAFHKHIITLKISYSYVVIAAILLGASLYMISRAMKEDKKRENRF